MYTGIKRTNEGTWEQISENEVTKVMKIWDKNPGFIYTPEDK